jgi:hypothetical protein
LLPYELQLIIGEIKEYNTFPLKELDEKELDIKTDDYPILVAEKAKILKDIFSSSKLVADSVMFDCKPNEVH